MANHRRGKPKNARAGCLMCKPWKINGAPVTDQNPQDKRRLEKAKQELREGI
jgi:hypothetical protein